MARPPKSGSQATAAATAARRAARQKARQQTGESNTRAGTRQEQGEEPSCKPRGTPRKRRGARRAAAKDSEEATTDGGSSSSNGGTRPCPGPRPATRAAAARQATAGGGGGSSSNNGKADGDSAVNDGEEGDGGRSTRSRAERIATRRAAGKLMPYIRPSAPGNKNNFQCAGCFQSVHALPRDLHAGGSSECMPCVLCRTSWCFDCAKDQQRCPNFSKECGKHGTMVTNSSGRGAERFRPLFGAKMASFVLRSTFAPWCRRLNKQ